MKKKNGMSTKTKMTTTKKWSMLSALLVLGLVLAGCGSAKNSEMAMDTVRSAMDSEYATDDVYAYESYAVEEEMAAEAPMAEAATTAGEGSAQTPEVQDTSRKLIKNVNLEVETETFDDLMVTLNDKTSRLGGYIEESYIYNGSNYYGKDSRNASLTIRIPAQSLEEFLSAVALESNVVSRNESVSDVTLQYVDMESHKKALQTEYTSLLGLLEKAETVEDIITLESRLSEVRYQIESMESQLRTMDNKVNYSTVYLNISEVKKYTPVKEQTIGEKIITGFTSNLYDVGEGLLDFAIGIIISLPYLIIWAVVILIIVLIIKAFIKKSKKKKLNQEQNRQQQYQQQLQQQQLQQQQAMTQTQDKKEGK